MRKGWDIKKLGDVCEMVKRGIAPKYTEEGGIQVINQKCIRDHKIDLGLSRQHDIDVKGVSQERLIRIGDVLVNSTGTGTLGRVAQVKNGYPNPVTVDTHVTIVRPHPNLFFNEYFGYALIRIEDEIKDSGEGTSGQTELSRTKLQNEFQIPIPPFTEQKQIVAILDEAFAAIDQAKVNLEKNIQNARELFQSKLNEVFSQGGKGWEERKIKDLTETVSKGSSPKWQGISYVDNPGILFVTSENVGEGNLLMDKRKYVEEGFNAIEKKSILKKGDVLTNIVGASIGRTAIFDLDEIANINQAVCLIRCTESKLYNFYLMYLLNSPYFKQILHENEVNNARANLSLAFFRNLQIPIPKIETQFEIVNKIQVIEQYITELVETLETKSRNIDELKKSLLQKAFTGELTKNFTETVKDLALN